MMIGDELLFSFFFFFLGHIPCVQNHPPISMTIALIGPFFFLLFLLSLHFPFYLA